MLEVGDWDRPSKNFHVCPACLTMLVRDAWNPRIAFCDCGTWRFAGWEENPPHGFQFAYRKI